MPPLHRLHLLAALLLASALQAQVPNTLLHSIPGSPDGLQSGAQLGNSVAVEGNYTVVGAALDDFGAIDSGVVKVFHSVTGALLFVLPNPSPAMNELFGTSVAISGSRIIVGAPRDNTVGFTAGSAYVYDLSSATPTVLAATLNNPSPDSFDDFGKSVAISGTRVVVGTYGDDMGDSAAGSAYVYDLASATPTVPIVTLNNPSPGFTDYFGFSVAISGSRVVIGAYQDDTGDTDAGSAYVYDLSGATPTVPIATLNNPSPELSDKFGYSVAISGERIIVGAYGDNTGATDAGSAYVYDLSSASSTVPTATLNNPAPTAGDYFGRSVAISGSRVVVGANQDDSGAGDAGSAYVYDLTSATPTVPIVTLNNPSPEARDSFGRAVAISDTRTVIGADQDDMGAVDAGSAYVYDLTSATPTVPIATLNDPGVQPNQSFGYSVATSGTRVVVGAIMNDTGAVDAGIVQVYDLNSASPTVPMVTLANPSPEANDNFGYSVAISGTRIVVGAHQDSTGVPGAGSAYVYDLASATPTVPTLTVNNPTPASLDLFGASVAISGTRIVVGAFRDDTGAFDAGSAYVYDLNSATPTVPVVTLANPTPAASDFFGRAVAISGTRVVVGAYQDNTGAFFAGSAYVYDLTSATPAVPTVTLNNPSPAYNDWFGYSVAISGTRVVVGTYGDDTGATNAGSAYVYDLTSATPTVPAVTLYNPSPAALDYFGWSVAISDTRIVVGAYQDDTGDANAGSAYVYDLSSGTSTVPIATLNNPSPGANDNFGYRVAISGNTIAIGVPADDGVMPDKGSVYIYGPHPLDQDSDGLLDAWELTYWPTTTGHGPLDDEDHDGYVEVLELAFGLNPTVPDPGGQPPVTNEGGYLTMTITKHPGVIYEVQSAATLLPGQPGSFSPATTTILPSASTVLKVRDNTLIGTTPARYLRVKVTTAP